MVEGVWARKWQNNERSKEIVKWRNAEMGKQGKREKGNWETEKRGNRETESGKRGHGEPQNGKMVDKQTGKTPKLRAEKRRN